MVRVTQRMLADRTLFNLQNNLQQMAILQERLSTGRRLNTPSDDPVDFPRALRIREDISSVRQFRNNADRVTTDLELTETALGSATNLLQRARELAVQAGNSTSPEARVAIADEISEILHQMIDLSNSTHSGRFIFAGSETTAKPFEREDGAVVYRGDDVTRDALIGTATPIGTNMTGNETFLHRPNVITGAVRLGDPSQTLIDALRLANPQFVEVPPTPDELGVGETSPSPNPNNHPNTNPNNFSVFTIYGQDIYVDITVDTLNDLVERINTTSEFVSASITSDGRLQIDATRADSLNLQDGPSNPGFPPQPTFGNNILSALGLHRRIQDRRDIDNGYPATNPINNAGTRSHVEVQRDTLIFAANNNGPPLDPSVPFPDNLALTDLNANVLTKLEGLRITIDGQQYDIDLSGLTLGSAGADAVVGTADDIRGSSIQDVLDLINNDPNLNGRAVAYIDDDGSGLGITATGTTEEFKVENLPQVFGHDITTRLTTVAGVRTYTRVGPITQSTKLTDIPGALTDGTDSLGVRQTNTVANPTNAGLMTIINGSRRGSVDLSQAVDIGDVLRAINNAGVGVEASINPAGTGLRIERIDTSTGPLSVQDVSVGTFARDLGFFGVLPPRTVPAAAAVVPANTLAASGIVAGTFAFQIHDATGQVLGNYSVNVTNPATETFEDLVGRLDAVDGAAGPGEGLFSADIFGGVMTLSSNFNGHTFHITEGNDTTGLVTTFTLDTSTLVTEAEVNAALPAIFPVAVNQDTASILGLAASGTVNETEEKNVFKSLEDFQAALHRDDNSGISTALADIDVDLEVILSARTVVGSRLNRLDATKIRLEDGEVFQRQQLSILEDADLAELISDLTTQENAFNAALSASSRVVQPSLLDFLR